MSSTFKNRIPKRKYRERAQPSGREHLGLLEKKQDYVARAKNYHQREDMMNKLKTKANLKNSDEFYFKMNKGKRNEEGKFVEEDDSDSDFDEKDYRASLKTENYSIVNYQRSIVQQKIEKLKAQLHLLNPEQKLNTHTIFVDNEQQLNNFKTEEHFRTTKELAENKMLDILPQALSKSIDTGASSTLKHKYTRLAEFAEKNRKLTKILLKLGQEKSVLGKERSKIKRSGGKKIHKFFLERKK